MKELNFLLIGQAHSVHFISLINYLDNFLNEIESENKNIIHKVYILPSYPYDWGTDQSVFKQRFRVLKIPVRKDINEKTNLTKKFKIFRRKIFALLPQFLKETFEYDVAKIRLINWDASVRKIFKRTYPLEINPLKSEIRLIKYATPHRFKHTLDFASNNHILNIKFDSIWIIDALSAGYLFEEIKKYIDTSGKIFLTSYGSDFFWFADKKNHSKKLCSLLKEVDYVQNETYRDKEILKKLKYRNNFFEPCHATFRSIESLEKNRDQIKRDKKFQIVIQGSNRFIEQDFVKKSLNSIYKCISKNISPSNKYKIAIFRSKKEDLDYWKSISNSEIDLIDYGSWLSQDDLFKLFGNSKFFIHPSMTDGVSNCCLEASFMDCLPITSPNNGFTELLIPEIKKTLITKKEDPYDFGYLIEKIINKETDEIKMLNNSIKNQIRIYLNEDKYKIVLNKIFK